MIMGMAENCISFRGVKIVCISISRHLSIFFIFLKFCFRAVKFSLYIIILLVGHNEQASDGRIYDVKALRIGGAVEPCVAVFDILFFNGKSLMDVLLSERIALLQSGNVLQKQDMTKIFVSKFIVVKTRSVFVLSARNQFNIRHQNTLKSHKIN